MASTLSTQEEANIQIANTTRKCSQSEKVLGIILDNQLKFDQHVENICQKASRKSNALARVTNYMELPDPIHSVFNGSESASYLERKIWEEIPTDIKKRLSHRI